MKRKRKEKIKNAGVSLVLLLSLLTLLVTPVISDDYDPSDTHSGALVASSSNVTVGDTFNVTLYINSGTDGIQAFAVREVEWNTTSAGIINMTTNPGGTPNTDLNCSFPGAWGNVTFSTDDGNLDNSIGNLSYGPQSFSIMDTISGNHTGAVFNFTAIKPGFVSILIPQTWSGSSGLDIGGGAADWWTNCSVTVHPQAPTGLTATSYNYTIINVTGMVRPSEADTVLLCGKAGSYPANYGDSLLYNGTNSTYNHTGLTNCTAYYYRAWTYNETGNVYSILNQSDYTTTQCYTNFSFAGVTPTNGSTSANCTYSIAVNLTVSNSIGSSFTYWINGSNGQTTTATGATNGSYGRTLSSLSHNTSYWWNVTVTDGAGDSLSAMYTFTTGIGGGTSPAGSNPGPTNGATNVVGFSPTFNITVTDADSDPINTTFYWTNGTVIGFDDYTATGDSATTTFSGNLNLNTTYYWYARVNDTASCGDTTRVPASGTYSFTTQASAVAVYKEWDVTPSNMIIVWVNTTNNGAINLTNVMINESYHSNISFGGSTPTNDSGINNRWTATYLNVSGYENHWFNVTIYLNLSGRIANGTSISNTAWTVVNDTNTTASPTALTFSYYAVKELHGSMIAWNATTMNYSVNITNSGDFYLNWVQWNETYFDNTSFNDSNISPAIGNATFNITSINPGATSTNWILLNINASAFANGTNIWNNLTLTSNETSPEISQNFYNVFGAMTEAIRITYISSLTEVTTIGENVLQILGILLIISAILMIVFVVYKYGLYGE